MPHSPLDIYAQARFLDPLVFGTSAALFRRRWCAMGGFEMRQVKGLLNPILFSERLAGMMHTIEADVLTLPPTTDTVIPVTLDPPALKHAKAIVRDFMTTLEGGERVTAPMAATTILRLQQIGSGFARDVDGVDHPVGVEKAKALAVLFDGIAPDEPIVVFARFKHDLMRIHREAEDCRGAAPTSCPASAVSSTTGGATRRRAAALCSRSRSPRATWASTSRRAKTVTRRGRGTPSTTA